MTTQFSVADRRQTDYGQVESPDAPTTYTGSTVTDQQGNVLGKVNDVVFESNNTDPTWMVVKPGFLRAERFVPTRGAYRVDSGTLAVPYSRHQVGSAPKAGDGHVVDSRTRADLVQHFGIEY